MKISILGFPLVAMVLSAASKVHAIETTDKSDRPKCGSSYFSKGVKFKRYCEKSDFQVGRNHDGFFAWIQGHARGSSGETVYGWSGFDIDMNGHRRDVSCCKGNGVLVGSFDEIPKDVVLRNGYIEGNTGVFVLGGVFREKEDYSEGCSYKSGLIDYFKGMPSNLHLINLVLQGRFGGVAAVGSSIESSKIGMATIRATGLDFAFLNNSYVMKTMTMMGARQVVGQTPDDRLTFLVNGDIPYLENSDEVAYPAALHLSCADNATISNNIFTAKTKIPGAYAIVLKHSKNVRITNNTFEGFTVPVLMDKYSSIIDDSGNVIKPDVTINSPQSRLYKVDLDHVQGDTRRPWWQFWQ